jgi:murein DD-endopeptidase MepM/ murein hydrolase activator NlpD
MNGGMCAAALLSLALIAPSLAQDAPLHLTLPTDNDALLRGDPADFYQAIERNVHGVISHPWQGGQYGFVRDPIETATGTIMTRFHEGMDVRPVRRDVHGEPLDDVRSIADGIVVHINSVAGHSNYGRYVVIEHRWGGCPYYSLYGHLKTIAVEKGQRVQGRETIGLMGYTGAGINRQRAHVHVELNLLLNDHFEQWHESSFKGETNYNEIYNGINLAGMDLPRLFLALRDNPALTIPEFLAKQETYYKVIVPNSLNFQLPQRYPWMRQGAPDDKPAAWEVSFTRSGLPLRMTPSSKSVTGPELSFVKPAPIDYRHLTRGDLAGRGASAHLSDSGKALMRLLTFPD